MDFKVGDRVVVVKTHLDREGSERVVSGFDGRRILFTIGTWSFPEYIKLVDSVIPAQGYLELFQ